MARGSSNHFGDNMEDDRMQYSHQALPSTKDQYNNGDTGDVNTLQILQ
jgi:hypothetical protein